LDRSIESTSKSSQISGIENKVTLITFHNTKGLEFKKVIMTGLEQNVFPREGKKGEELEEERRLFYVGATRAMDELYLCSCSMRRMFGKTMLLDPSVFLREIDKSCLKMIGNVPRSFGTAKLPSGNKGNFGKNYNHVPKKVETIPGWRRGQKIFHDDYGYGSVTEVKNSDEGPVVKAVFETGMEKQFLADHQGSAYEKIGDE
jgi:DNA helicase-2/ATP-dependent DNA helicase PcrA